MMKPCLWEELNRHKILACSQRAGFKGQGGRGSFFLSLHGSLNSEEPRAVVAVSLKMSLYSHHCLKKGAQVNDQG